MTKPFSFERGSLKWLASCCIVCNVTTKPIPTFVVGDRIKAKLIELWFRSHMLATRP